MIIVMSPLSQRLLRLSAVLVGLVLVGILIVRGGFWQGGTAYAVGDLTIDWGVPVGDPIFVVTDMVPGQLEERDVMVTNNAVVPRTVGVRSQQTANTGIGDVLDIVVAVDGVPVYGAGSATGPQNLSQFFLATAAPDGMDLFDLDPSASATVTFGVMFNDQANNLFQARETVFDITLGVTGAAVMVPEECSHIEFSGDPIIGTAGSDRLVGSAGNDLIFGLEGSDSIRGQGGDDCIVGGPGSDSLRGRDGNDVLFGNDDSDSLRGDDGEDVLFGGAGTDSLRGDGDADRAYGGDGDDSLRGGRGDDELVGGPGDDVARGQQGTDMCEAEVEHSCEL